MSLSLFRKPGIYTAWGLKDGQWTPEAFVDKVADAGFAWVAQEIGDPNTQPSDDLITRCRNECHRRGIYWGIWEDKPNSLQNLVLYRPNLWILNVESNHTDYSTLLHSFRIAHPNLPAGVVTNCDILAAPFIAANIKAMPEAYQNDNAEATPENMMNRCHEMGWRVVFPVLGCYHDYPLSSYMREGDGYSVYLAEEMSDADFTTAKAWNT